MNAITQNQAVALTIDIDSIIAEWLDYEAKMNDAFPNTITAYQRGIVTFREWLGSKGLNEVLPVDVVDYKKKLSGRYSAQTVNLRLTAIRSFYRFAINRGYALLNPASEVKGIKRSKAKQHKRDALTNLEVSNVLAQPDPISVNGLRDQAILILLSHCALRSVEIHRADIEDLRTRGDRLTLDVQGKGRSEKDEYVVIPISQEPVIRDWLKVRLKLDNSPNSPLFPSLSNRTKGQRMALRSIRAMVKQRYQDAGVVGDKKSTHSLRHSAVTNAIRAGATPLQVQAMARHQSFDTTLNYYHEVGRLDNPAEDLISYGEE